MMRVTRDLLATCWLLALALSPLSTAGAEELRYFRDWLASCDRTEPIACRASSFHLRDGGPEYNQALRLERQAPATPESLVFESTNARLLEGAALELRVDDGPATDLPAGGYELGPEGRVLTITDREATHRLLPQLRSGNRLRVGFTTADGQARSVSFSLLGLTAALEFMQAIQGAAAIPTSLPRDFRCLGQEPFWNLEIHGESARLRQLGEEGDGQDLAGQPRAMGYLAVPTLAWRGRAPEASGDVVVFITRERCSDTMADRPPYAYAARLSLPGGEARFGCCDAQAAIRVSPLPRSGSSVPVAQLADKPTQDWSHRLLDLMPAIRLCLERAPQPARTVITAWTLDDGRVGIRLIGEPPERFECIVDPDGGRIERFSALSPQSPGLPGEGMPLYLPARAGLPQAECYDRERVLAPDGTLLGYLAYDTCFRAPQDSPEQQSGLPGD
jgi:uncharacterized membrane protein